MTETGVYIFRIPFGPTLSVPVIRMDSRTRRQVLAAAAVATGGMAGCLGSETSVSRSESSTEGPGRTVPDEQATTEPPLLFRRSDTEQPPIRLADTGEREGDSEADDEGVGDHGHHPQYSVIDSASMADRLVDNTTETSGEKTDLAEFVSSTEFDTETLYLETRQVEQCFRLSLCYISWQDNEIRTDYGRLLRPYDERCSVDTTAFESRLFRLPIALDADEINGYGSSTSSSRCHLAERRATGNRSNQSTESRTRTNDSMQSPNGSESA